MSRTALKASLALWRRRHTYRQRKLDIAHAKNDAKAIKKWHGLLVTAGQNIRRREKQLTPKAAPKGIRQRTVDHARSFVGTVEQPAGSNRGPLITSWQRTILGGDGYAWCGCFAGCMLLWAGVQGVGSWIAGVAAIEDQAVAHRGPFTGWTTDPAKATRGSLVVLFGRGVHVAIVDSVDLKRKVVHTIEGNTSPPKGSGSQSNGGGVWARERPLSEVHGYALVNYPG